MIKTILQKEDPALHKVCHAVTKFDRKLEALLNDLTDTLKDSGGLGLAAIGLNCSFGPLDAQPVIEEFAQKTDIPLLLKPNTADLGPEDFAKAVEPSLPHVSYLGACCGSDPSYIRALRQTVLDDKII